MQRMSGSTIMKCSISLLVILLVATISGCGEDSSSNTSASIDGNTGSAVFSVKWIGSDMMEDSTGNRYRALSDGTCAELNITKVYCDVIDDNNEIEASNDWYCEERKGVIEGITTGHGYKFVVYGKDDQQNVLYRGEKSGITITGGQTEFVGTIDTYTFNPNTLVPEDGSTVTTDALQLMWSVVEDINTYRIQISNDSSFTTYLENELVSNTVYKPENLLTGSTYYWRVRAIDSKGIASPFSDTLSFSISNIDMTVSIDAPANNSFHEVGDTVTFIGTAQDASGSGITGTSLVWISDTDGVLGTGETINVSLSEGEHRITLQATDSNANVGIETIKLTVSTASPISNGCDGSIDCLEIFTDHFDDDVLDPQWVSNPDGIDDWTYSETGSELVVTNIESTTTGWGSVNLQRSLRRPLSDFSIDFIFSWDSEENVSDCQNVLIQIYSDVGKMIAAGYGDGWLSFDGGKVGHIGNDLFETGPSDLHYTGSAHVRIDRVGSRVDIFWDDELLNSGDINAEELVYRVDLVFSYRNFDNSTFGTETVDLISVYDTSP